MSWARPSQPDKFSLRNPQKTIKCEALEKVYNIHEGAIGMLITKCGAFFRDKNEGETSQRTVQLFTFLEQLKDSI